MNKNTKAIREWKSVVSIVENRLPLIKKLASKENEKIQTRDLLILFALTKRYKKYEATNN